MSSKNYEFCNRFSMLTILIVCLYKDLKSVIKKILNHVLSNTRHIVHTYLSIGIPKSKLKQNKK